MPAQPTDGLIAVTNHLSIVDSPALMLALPYRIFVFAASKHRTHPLYGPLVGLTRPIWVRRGEIDRDALRQAVEVLRRGDVLGMAPEGTRSKTHTMQAGKTGAAYLATRAGVQLLPVGMWGTEKVIRNMLRLRRTDVYVRIGEPFRLPERPRARSQELDEYTDLIMRKIAALIPAEYRGIYA